MAKPLPREKAPIMKAPPLKQNPANGREERKKNVRKDSALFEREGKGARTWAVDVRYASTDQQESGKGGRIGAKRPRHFGRFQMQMFLKGIDGRKKTGRDERVHELAETEQS